MDRSPNYSEQLNRDGLRTTNDSPQHPPEGSYAEHDKLIIATVPHTGTNALKRAFSPYYPDLQDFPHKIPDPRLHKMEGRQLVCTHIRKETDKIVRKPWKTITPIRDPMLTLISQAARKKYDKFRMKPERVIGSWKRFIKYYNEGLLEIVPMDSDFLGVELEWVTSTKKFELHEAYEQGDFETVRQSLKEDSWDQMIQLGPQLKSIFEKEGYSFPWLS